MENLPEATQPGGGGVKYNAPRYLLKSGGGFRIYLNAAFDN
jgi:hypothetical protein